MMIVFSIITGITGGVALFLYGMNALSNSLTTLAGGRFESMLEKFTDKRIKGWLLATLITAIVQSSSATTVLTVGLVNSGILQLSQSVSLIIGANLGTTATAWLLSLNSLQSESFILTLLSPSTFCMYLAIIGVALQMFSKDDKKKTIGGTLMGFSIMMIGMKLMSSAITPLKENPDFESLLTTFSNPLIVFVVALLFTLIIQSSDATIGMLQALAMTVSVNALLAIPIVCGSQIGTCISALISSLASGKNGKRAALIQLYYNLIKNVPFILIFYFFSMSSSGTILKKAMSVIDIAIFHSGLNLVFSIIMLPLSGFLVILAIKTIPYSEDEIKSQKAKLTMLDPLFLKNHAYAIVQTKEALKIVSEDIEDSFKAFYNGDCDSMMQFCHLADEHIHAISNYITKIAQYKLTDNESTDLSALRKISIDYEIINNRLKDIYGIRLGMQEKDIHFSEKTEKDVKILAEATFDILSIVMGGLSSDSSSIADAIKGFSEIINELHSTISSRYLKRLHNNQCSKEGSFYFTEICYAFERIIDRCDDIGHALTIITREKSEDAMSSSKSSDIVRKLFIDKYTEILNEE